MSTIRLNPAAVGNPAVRTLHFTWIAFFLAERNPLLFWKVLALVFFVAWIITILF